MNTGFYCFWTAVRPKCAIARRKRGRVRRKCAIARRKRESVRRKCASVLTWCASVRRKYLLAWSKRATERNRRAIAQDGRLVQQDRRATAQVGKYALRPCVSKKPCANMGANLGSITLGLQDAVPFGRRSILPDHQLKKIIYGGP